MSGSVENYRIQFEKPGAYKIVVQGILSADWSDRLAGMQIITENPDAEAPATRLMGYLRDQTQLYGVLNSLYNLHLPILSVEHLGDEESIKYVDQQLSNQ